MRHSGIRNIVKTAAVACTLSGAVASAECLPYVCDGSRILALYTQANGDAFVQISGNTSLLTCGLVSGTYVRLRADSLRFKEIYASLLAYQLTDRPLSVRMKDGVTECTLDYIYAS